MALGRVVYYHKLVSTPLIGGSVYLGGSLEAGNTWQPARRGVGRRPGQGGQRVRRRQHVHRPFYFAYGRATEARPASTCFSAAQ
jgi:hypothetical protein